MGLLSITRRVGTDAAGTLTGAAAAVTGAAYGAATGAVTGATRGARQALGTGPRAMPAAALGVAAVGAAGLVDWPILLAAGGAALVLRQLRPPPAARSDTAGSAEPVRQGRALATSATTPSERPAPRATAAGEASATKASGSRTTAARKTSTPRKAPPVRKGANASAASSTKNDRPLVANPDGGRDIKDPEANRVSDHTDTQAQAVSRSREHTETTGGDTTSPRPTAPSDPAPPLVRPASRRGASSARAPGSSEPA